MAFSLFTYSTNRVSTSPLFEDYIFFFFSHSRKRTVAFRRGVKARESSARCGGSFALVLADFATDAWKVDLTVVFQRNFYFYSYFFLCLYYRKETKESGELIQSQNFRSRRNDYMR